MMERIPSLFKSVNFSDFIESKNNLILSHIFTMSFIIENHFFIVLKNVLKPRFYENQL